jgi:hypothetical protein
VKLVLQCAMCGTHHAVGTPACTTCRASGVTQMRLMFECPTCGHLGINPVCEACPIIEPLELDDDLIVAEEVTDDSTGEDFEDFDLDLEDEFEEDEALVVDLSEENFDDEEDESDSELDDSELDEDIEEDDLDEDDSELDDDEDPLDEEDEDD